MAGMFHWSDYIVFVLCLVVSMSVGIYHGLAKGGQKTTNKYLQGAKHMHFVPLAVSLAVSILSSITVQGFPAEAYLFGAQIILFPVGFCLAVILATYTFVPMHYTLQLNSVNEYLELRFNSKSVRILGCFMAFLMQCCYVGCLMFGPAIALELAVGLQPLISICVINLIGIIYTAIGGLTAVIYTDFFQSIVMISGVGIVLALAIVKSGGFGSVISENQEWGRLFIDFSVDPQVRVSFWTCTVGTMFLFLAHYGVNQSCTQRYRAMATVQQAKRSCYIVCAFALVLNVIASTTGAALFAYYSTQGCDPLANDDITNPNQLLPLFVLDAIGYPVISGLFISCLVSSALSSLSSAVNAMAALLWEDLFKDHFQKLDEAKQASVTKVLAVGFGLASSCVSFIAYVVGGNLMQVTTTILSALAGPLLGLHLMGALIPWGNWIGAVTGSVTSLVFLFWMLIGQIFNKRANQPLPTPTYGCDVTNATILQQSYVSNNTAAYTYSYDVTSMAGDTRDDDIGVVQWIYTVSFSWFGLIGVTICLVLGTIVSFITGPTNPQTIDKKLYFPFLHSYCGVTVTRENEYEARKQKETESFQHTSI